MKLKYAKTVISSLTFGTLFSSSSLSQEIDDHLLYQPTQSSIGGSGLLQMPTGRMNREGEFTAFYNDNNEYRRLGLSIQLFPWLEATLRYNDIRTRRYSDFDNFSGDQTYKDRGVDVKFRLWDEGQWLPETSVGFRDLAGTGKFAGEYFVASKRFGPLDFSLGLGFGYLGKRDSINNPFCEASDSFCERPLGVEGTGGDFDTDSWFKGDTAVFGGIEYQTPWKPLSFKLEYDGNDYSDEPSLTRVPVDSPWNIGAHYRLNDNTNLMVSYERGNTFMFGFNFRMNFNDVTQVKRVAEIPTASAPKYESIQEIDLQQLANEVYGASGYNASEITFSENTQEIYIIGFQSTYLNHKMSIDRAAAVLANNLPNSVKKYHFVDKAMGQELGQTIVDAATFKQAHYRSTITTRYEDSYQLVDADAQKGDRWWKAEHDISWPHIGIRPYLEQSFGGPENFYMYQLRLDAQLSWAPLDSFRIDGTVSTELFGNYDEFNFLVDNDDTGVPRVRTYVREYATQSDIWLTNLQATYFKKLSKNLFTSYYGGYLERMFVGAGSEWLYRPHNDNWALGADINYAKQRSFESHFGLRDYDVVTGHLTAYYEPEFIEDSLIKVAAGRFLAKDNGVQVNFEKKFDSGIIVGAFASKTNLSAEQYGEGSFTKGFYISIPFDLFQMRHSGMRAGLMWTPLTRDGGQMLNRTGQLHGLTDARSRYYSEFE